MAIPHYLHVPTNKQTQPGVRGQGAATLLQQIESFLATCNHPALLEAGESILSLQPGEYSLELENDSVVLECWGQQRVLRRRLKGIRKAQNRQLEVVTERFPKKRGTLSLLDLDTANAPRFAQESRRGAAREQLRHWCEQLQPGWRVECLSAAPDLEHSLSPRFPRALLRYGGEGIAAIAAPGEEEESSVGDAPDVFTFGILWLQHCRQRWRELRIHTLLLICPEPAAAPIALRLQCCNHARLQYRLVTHSKHGVLQEVAPRVWGNLSAKLCLPQERHLVDERLRALFSEVALSSEAEYVEDLRGVLSLELRGLPFARAERNELRTGFRLQPTAKWPSAESLIRSAHRIARTRCANFPDSRHALARLYPERWLESVVRQEIRVIDPTLQPHWIRRQVTGRLGTQRTRTDLLALDEAGRLVIIELKADADIQLVSQALDYHARLKRQIEAGSVDFGHLFSVTASPQQGTGGQAPPAVQPVAPRVILVAPALSFHPASETLLPYLESSISVTRVGIALEWRKTLRVVFQHNLDPSAREGSTCWPAIYSSKSARHSPP